MSRSDLAGSKRRFGGNRLSLATLVPFAFALAPAASAQVVVAICDEAHLRNAIAAVEQNGGGTVTFSCSGTITVMSPFTIAAPAPGITIDGTGQNVIISGGNIVQVMQVSVQSSPGSLILNKLTITNGSVSNGHGGGAIENDGATVTVNNCTFSGNNAIGSGGAIDNNSGTLTVNNSTFSSNTASGNPQVLGGAIENYVGALTVNSSTFSGNAVTGSGVVFGGAIDNFAGTLTVNNSMFSLNTATGSGGAFVVGGAIQNDGGILAVSNSTFVGNTASGTSLVLGGAINNVEGNGQKKGQTASTVTNSTFFGNTVTGSGEVFGGAIYNDVTTLTVTFSTLSANSAPLGGDIYNNSGIVGFQNTIVAGATSGGNCGGGMYGTIIDLGYNLDDGITCGFSSTNSSLSNTNPKLGPLANNGGPTQTMALLSGSPAIDKIQLGINGCGTTITTDQRGIPRPQGTGCDIGAYELVPQLIITASCPLPSVQTGSFLSPVLLTATGGLGLGTYTFSVIGNLPPNLQLSMSAISGQVTASPGNYLFTLQVISGTQTAQKPCSITVTAAALPLQITSACPASPITQGVSFYYNFTATGGTGSYSWSIVTGSLPNGLALLASYIYGTPTGPPSTSNFTIQVLSGDQTASLSCSLTVSPPQLQVTSGCPGKGTQGVAYGPFTLTATGGLGPGTYTFSIQGSLPPGVTLSGNTISGTPTASGTYSFTVSVTSGTQTVTGPSCSVTIAPPPLLLTGSCPASPSLTGVLVSFSVSVTGGQSPYNFTLSGPSWLTLNSSGPNATASGTPGPTNVGSFPITITVTDSAKSTPATFNCTLIVNRPALQLSGTCPANPITAGASISIPLGATGGLPPYNWTLGGNSSLGLSSPSGASNSVTGNAPGALGNYSVTIGLSDSANSTASLSCTLNVQLPALLITGTCPAASLNLPLSLSVPLTAAGGQPPYSWSLTAPPWLALSSQTGPTTTIANSGPPDTYGPFSFTATLKDSANATTAFSCSSSINQPVIPTVTITGLTATTTLTQTVSVGLQLAAPAPLPLTGVVQLSFIPNAFGVTDNPQVVFDGGLRTQSFSLAAGQSTVALPDTIQQGTVAGTIHVEVVDLKQGTNEVLPTPHPFSELVIPRSAPVIAQTDVTFANETSTGFDVVISGFSTPRDMKTVALTFSAAQGATLTGTVSFSVDVSTVFTQYYSSQPSQLVGSMFQNLHVPVTVTGDKTAIGSVSVVMSNSVGNSPTITLTR